MWMNQKSKPTNSRQPNVSDWKKEKEKEASGLTALQPSPREEKKKKQLIEETRVKKKERKKRKKKREKKASGLITLGDRKHQVSNPLSQAKLPISRSMCLTI